MVKELIMYMEEKGIKNPSIRFSYDKEDEKYEFFSDKISLFNYTVVTPEKESRNEKRSRHNKIMNCFKDFILENSKYYFNIKEDLDYLKKEGIHMIVQISTPIIDGRELDHTVRFYKGDEDVTNKKAEFVLIMEKLTSWYYRRFWV